MAEETHINVGGSWEKVSTGYVNVSGTWRRITEIWTKVSGTWEAAFTFLSVTFSAGAQYGSGNRRVDLTAVPADGASPYAYLWEYISGDLYSEISGQGTAMYTIQVGALPSSTVIKVTVTDAHSSVAVYQTTVNLS